MIGGGNKWELQPVALNCSACQFPQSKNSYCGQFQAADTTLLRYDYAAGVR